jgi:hypothetical protein
MARILAHRFQDDAGRASVGRNIPGSDPERVSEVFDVGSHLLQAEIGWIDALGHEAGPTCPDGAEESLT